MQTWLTLANSFYTCQSMPEHHICDLWQTHANLHLDASTILDIDGTVCFLYLLIVVKNCVHQRKCHPPCHLSVQAVSAAPRTPRGRYQCTEASASCHCHPSCMSAPVVRPRLLPSLPPCCSQRWWSRPGWYVLPVTLYQEGFINWGCINYSTINAIRADKLSELENGN